MRHIIKLSFLAALAVAGMAFAEAEKAGSVTPVVASRWLSVNMDSDNALGMCEYLVMRAGDGRLIYSDGAHLSLGEIGKDFRKREIMRNEDDDRIMDMVRKLDNTLKKQPSGSVDLSEPILKAVALAVNKDLVYLYIGIRTNSADYRLVEALKGDKLRWAWYVRVGKARAEEYDAYEPFEVTPNGEIVIVSPDSATALLVCDPPHKTLKQLRFDVTERPKGTPIVTITMSQEEQYRYLSKESRSTIEFQEKLKREGKWPAPKTPEVLPLVEAPVTPVAWTLTKIETVKCMGDGTLLVTDGGLGRAARISLDGKVLATFEKDPEKGHDRRYLGAGKDFIIAIDDDARSGLLLTPDGKEIGTFPTPTSPVEATDSYRRAMVLDDETMFLFHGPALDFYKINMPANR